MLYYCDQRSEEWFDLRLGKVTCSRLNDVLAKRRDMKEAAARIDYRIELITERLTGHPIDHFVSFAMREGTENEPLAIAEYEYRTGKFVKPVGCATHPTIQRFCGSPDGLVGETGLIEVKCLKPENHTDVLLAQAVPPEFLNQIMGQLACTGRAWCDFVSYSAEMPEDMQIFICRVERHDPYIRGIESEVITFLDGVDAEFKKLRSKYEGQSHEVQAAPGGGACSHADRSHQPGEAAQ